MLQNTSSPTYAKDQAKAKTGDIDKVMLGTLGLGLAPIAAQAAPAALAPGSAFWSSPITQGIAASSLGAQAVNTASNAVMHKDWSTAMSDAIQNSTGYRPSEYLTEFTNPGAWLGMGGAKLNISGNPIQQIKDIYNLGKAASNYTGKYVQNKINLNKVGNKLMQNIDNATLPNELINDASKQYSTESKDVLDDTILNMPNYSGSDGKFNTNQTQVPKISRPITDRQVQAFNGDFDLINKDGSINKRAAARLNRKLKDNGISLKDNVGEIKFGYAIKDSIRKKDLDKYKQLISSKKMFDSIINEKLGTLKTKYKVSREFRRFSKNPTVLKQIMDEYGAIPRYQMDGFGEYDLFLNNGKKSAKSKIASEGYLLGKRGQKVVDVEDVQYIHKGVSRKEIQQRNNGNIDRQDQTENLSMKNLRNVILPVLGLGALKKKNKK